MKLEMAQQNQHNHDEYVEEVNKVVSYDGQVIWAENRVPLYEVGNFLGGGAAGTVYEAENVKTKIRYALKILNPIGYKLLSPALLRRCNIISKGRPVPELAERSKEVLTKENIWWVLNGSTKQYLAAYYSEKQRALNELSLLQCIQIWGSNPQGIEGAMESLSPGRAPSSLPLIPPKYVEFVRKRNRIFREINNMRKISPHINVIRLEHVLELAQDSKCTIFLVMELANGGELFDRIKIDCGTREKTAKKFFLQLLAGVRHCHQEGVCHRDLKPENLLLQDIPSAPDGSILKIADFGFSARVVLGAEDFGDSHHMNVAATLRSVVGSPFYVAPEVLQAQPQGYDGLKADAWSLGVILYAMLAGNLPFAQELSTCRRFKQFGIWAAEQCAKSERFWEEPTLVYPPWLFSSKFSPLARSLIVAFLLPDPHARISVSESQKHPWCAEDEEEELTPPVLHASSSTEGLGLQFASAVPSPLSANEHSAFSPSHFHANTTPQVSTGENNVIDSSALPSPTKATPLPSPSALSMALQSISNGGVLPDHHPKMFQNVAAAAPTAVTAPVATTEAETVHPEGDEGATDHTEPFAMDDTSDDGMEFDDEYKDTRTTAVLASAGAGTGKASRTRERAVMGNPEKETSESVFGSCVEKVADSPPVSATTAAMLVHQHTAGDHQSDLHGYSKRLNSSTPTPIPRDLSGYQRRSFVTPPPVPVDEVPYIVAGTPDLLSSLVYGTDASSCSSSSRSHSNSLSADADPIPISPLHRAPASTGSISSHPPSFHDRVKKSTRFITSVPAHDVLETVEGILQQCRLHKTVSPIGLIGRVEVHWDNYRLDVWGIADSLPSSPPACSLHLYQLPSSTPQSPAREFSLLGSSPLPRFMQAAVSSSPIATPTPQPQQGGTLYLVEFVRGQLEIFPFKRFYEWIRQRISELVKRDYAWDLFDQAGSPIRPSLLSESPRSTHHIPSQYGNPTPPSPFLGTYSISS